MRGGGRGASAACRVVRRSMGGKGVRLGGGGEAPCAVRPARRPGEDGSALLARLAGGALDWIGGRGLGRAGGRGDAGGRHAKPRGHVTSSPPGQGAEGSRPGRPGRGRRSSTGVLPCVCRPAGHRTCHRASKGATTRRGCIVGRRNMGAGYRGARLRRKRDSPSLSTHPPRLACWCCLPNRRPHTPP